jgi:flagellar assembly protein FliH
MGSFPSSDEAPAAVEDSAFAAGLAAGRAAALAEEGEALSAARKALERVARSLERAASELSRARAKAVEVEVHELAKFALELVEAIVGELPKGLSARRVRQALALAPVDEPPLLRLHPDDLAAAESVVAGVRLLADPAVQKGGCVVEVGPTRIDAEVAPALSRLRAALGGGSPLASCQGGDAGGAGQGGEAGAAG